MCMHGNTCITNTLYTHHTHPYLHTHTPTPTHPHPPTHPPTPTHPLTHPHTHTHVCSPVIVADDANLEVAGRRIVWGRCANAGQTCISPDYVLCTAAKKDRLLNACRTAIQEFFGMVCIPMVMKYSIFLRKYMGTLMTHSPSKVCPPLNTTRPRDVGIADQRKAGKECKMLLFCAKTIEKESHNFELACLNKKKE